MLHVHRSHDVAALADVLVALLEDCELDPFVPHRVMVSSSALRQLLEVHAATTSRERVLANVELGFPSAFVEDLVTRLLGRPAQDEALAGLVDDVDPWRVEHLTWVLCEHLPDLVAHTPGLERLGRVLAGRGGQVPAVVDRRMLSLAGQVARVLDGYALHRPLMLRAWRDGRDVGPEGPLPGVGPEGPLPGVGPEGPLPGVGPERPLPGVGPDGSLPEEERWQPVLVRELERLRTVPTAPSRVEEAVRLLADGRVPADVPPLVCVFGITTLPPLQLELLGALSAHREVHLLVPSPSPRAWTGEAPRSQLLQAGGPVARDSGRLLRPLADVDEHLPGTPPPSTLLGRLQASVLDDLPLRPADDVADDDRSVVFHDCHGPLRQVEALRDELQRRLDDPGPDPLQPRDVLVLTPDPATFAPLVSAVMPSLQQARWVALDGAPQPVPVAVADRALGRANPVATVLRRALRLVDGRVGASDVLDLAGDEPVRRRFDLSPGDLETLGRWVDDTGVRWARDEDDRAHAGQPRRRSHTWAAGLDRLLLGVAMADEGGRRLQDVVPYDHVEDGGDLDLLERLRLLLDVVDGLRDLREPRSVREWVEDLDQLLDELTGPRDGLRGDDRATRRAHQRAREQVDRTLTELARVQDLVSRDVDAGAVARWLDEALRTGGGGAARASSAATFAEIDAMRAVPARVVCLLGMDEGALPRSSTRPGFDLLNLGEPRPGDPDRRAQDRHLVLETLLAARDALVVCSTGRDQRTGRERPPAVAVQELRDAVRTVVGTEGLRRRTHVHGVLPVSPASFAGDDPWSYDGDRRAAAEALLRPPGDAPDPVPSPLPAHDPVDELTPDELARRLRDPLRALADTLRLARAEEGTVRPAVEPLELDPLQQSGVGRALLAEVLAGAAPDAAAAAAALRGPVPAGAVGRRTIAPVLAEVDGLVRLQASLGPARVTTVDVTVGGLRVVGPVAWHDRDGLPTVAVTAYRRPGIGLRIDLRVHQLLLAVHLDRAVAGIALHRSGGRPERRATVLAPVQPEDARAELAPLTDVARRAPTERVALLPAVAWPYVARRITAEAALVAAGHDRVLVEGADHDELLRLDPDVPAGKRSTVADELRRAMDDARTAWEGGFAARAARDDDAARLLLGHAETLRDLLACLDVRRDALLLRPLAVAVADGAAEAKSLVEEVLR